jgi:hypothetical protein
LSRMPAGVGLEQLTVAARRVPLDALSEHLGAVVVVGAQAVHLRTSSVELAGAGEGLGGPGGLDAGLGLHVGLEGIVGEVSMPQSVWWMRMISRVPSRRWLMARERISSSVTTPPALRITWASPSARPRMP